MTGSRGVKRRLLGKSLSYAFLLIAALLCVQGSNAANDTSSNAAGVNATGSNAAGSTAGTPSPSAGNATAGEQSGAAGGQSQEQNAAGGQNQGCESNTITKFTHGGGGFYNATFTMAVHIEPPFVFFNPEAENEEDIYTGFTIEVARLLEAELRCKFKFIVGDPANPEPPAGALSAIGQIPGGPKARADVAGGALHISANNSRAVHYSLPFHDTGFVMVVPAPLLSPNPWSFTAPFHPSLWVAVIVEILIVALACWLMEAPVCSIFRDTDVVDGFFNGFWDSLYWSITLLLQTPDKAPRTWGGKMVLVAHGWFMLIVIASYTANLASFLTAAEATPILNSWSDIVNSKGAFKLALPRGLSHEAFIAVESKHYPDANFNVLWTDTWEEAFEQVRNGTADATFHDEPVAQNFIIRKRWQCDLIEVGKVFNSFGYGFAFNYDDTNFIAYSQAIVYLKETGLIDDLLRKYQIGPIDSGASDSCKLTADDEDQMSWDEMQGLTIMVGVCIIIGFGVSAVERIMHGKTVLMCCQGEAAEDDKAAVDPNSNASKFSRRQASQLAAEVAADQREEDRQALAATLRAGVRAGVIEAVLKVARENEHNMRTLESNPNYKKQVSMMLEKASDQEVRIARWKHQMENGANPGEKAMLGKGGVFDMDEPALAQVHQLLAEWL